MKSAFAFSGCVPLTGRPFEDLARTEPRFREVLGECEAVVRSESDAPLFDDFRKAAPGNCLTGLLHCFPLVVALQIALFELLRGYGIDAGATVGMSCGEVSAAYAAGLIGLADAMRIAVHGARLMSPQANTFRMALVWAAPDLCARAIGAHAGPLSIAAFMEPGVVAISGERGALKTLLAALGDEKIRTHALPFGWGAHTPLLTDGRREFESILAGMRTGKRTRRILSTSLGQWEGSDFGAGHWWPMFSRPVLFQSCVRRMIDESIGTFLEVGPASALSELIPRIGGTVIPFDAALAEARVRTGMRWS